MKLTHFPETLNVKHLYAQAFIRIFIEHEHYICSTIQMGPAVLDLITATRERERCRETLLIEILTYISLLRYLFTYYFPCTTHYLVCRYN